MNTTKILSAPLIDIVFDGRNKDYGAYELRKTYPNRIWIALSVTFLIVFSAITAAALGNSSRKKNISYKITPGTTLIDIIPPKKDEPKPKTEVKNIPKPLVKTVILVTPKIVDKVEHPMPHIAEVDSSNIGDKKSDGIKSTGIAEPQEVKTNGNGSIDKPKEDPEQILNFVEIAAKFQGDWVKFLLKNLNPNVPVDNEAPAGTYSVVIKFVVDKEGNVSEVQALTNHGYGMEAEALRVVKKATKWDPAIQNGHKVKAYHKQVITFQVLE